ncbi:MAG: flavodoxin [Oxalobacteraceae bacterium]|nr:MAG: flavodoxin [Oxalobacteraceae bacterium]
MKPVDRHPPEPNRRRSLMTGLAGLSLGGAGPAAVAAPGPGFRPEAPVLVACFSRSGNTRVVAGLLQRALGADLFEILPATPYPEDYLATVEQARQERDRNIEPALKNRVSDMNRYATVFLGLPIWGETAPPIVRSFLSAHDLSGKTLVPFITHGGYGLGSSERVIARHAPKASLRPAFSMQADQERRTMNLVNAWLGDAPGSTR